MARWYSANVLQTNAGGRRLWQLLAAGDRFDVKDETILLSNEPLPPLIADKDWQTLFRDKLNVAWLPADKVFFRAVQLPASDPAELVSMVELQLEKLSPLPVTQAVWSMHLLPRPADKPDALQTVLVIIAARNVVEEFLGQLETEGFMADRLEAPGLEQFLAVKNYSDGVWIFAGTGGEPALAVWWYGGTVQHVTLTPLPSGTERGPILKTQLEQIAWAAELDGWLTGPIIVHLVAAAEDAEFWSSIFKDWGEKLVVVPPASAKQLAALSAQRCAGGAGTSLLPPEYSARYHQQFVDRLWIHGLVATATLYILGVLFYFGMLYVFQLKDDKVKRDLATLGPSYTNSMRDVEQIKILKDRQNLKYAALDCWKAVAESLPEDMTIESMSFSRGKLEMNGDFSPDSIEQVGAFNEALRTATDPVHNTSLFADVSPPHTQISKDKGTWSFNCTLKNAESE